MILKAKARALGRKLQLRWNAFLCESLGHRYVWQDHTAIDACVRKGCREQRPMASRLSVKASLVTQRQMELSAYLQTRWGIRVDPGDVDKRVVRMPEEQEKTIVMEFGLDALRNAYVVPGR